MDSPHVSSIPLKEFSAWDKLIEKRRLTSVDLEITARCNLNCRHCYINLPVRDKKAKSEELPVARIGEIAGQAISLGALWCTLTGGEPLLRPDFSDIFIELKKRGLLVSLNTNATLISGKTIELFKKYPPRDIEVTVYGVREKTYESVTRKPGSFKAFLRGLDLLLTGGINVRLKAMALRSNIHEWRDISRFCREKTKDYYRFDPFLHLRYDGNPKRNEEICSERLTVKEIIALEQSDQERFRSLEKNCEQLIPPKCPTTTCNHLFTCGAGLGHGVISYNGLFRLCFSLWHPDCVYDLKNGSLREAYLEFVPLVRSKQSNRRVFMEKCRNCRLINLCMWCPAHAHLETGELDTPVDYFCRIAHARAEMLGKK